jgi:hypothetical protein
MFVINNTNLKFISAFADHLELINIVRKNIHLRPHDPPKERPQAWWVYAISAVKDERKRLTTIIKSSAKNLLNMRKYIDLYKRKQTLVRYLNCTYRSRFMFLGCQESVQMKISSLKSSKMKSVWSIFWNSENGLLLRFKPKPRDISP